MAGCFGGGGVSRGKVEDESLEPAVKGRKNTYVLEKLNSVKPTIPELDEVVINLKCIDVDGLDIIEEGNNAGENRSQSSQHSSTPPVCGFCKVESRRNTQAPQNGLSWTNSRRALEVLVDREEAYSRANQDQGKTHSQRLVERLDRLNLQVHEMSGDGNCQFRSISHELFGSQDYHGKVRKRVMNHIKSNPDNFRCFLGEDFDDYVKAMSLEGCWGDELTLRAACESYGVVMHVVTSDETNWHLIYNPTGGVKCSVEVFIAYIAPIHYNAIRRKPSLKTMHDKLGESFKRMSSGRSSATSEEGR
mmetsp:Transcript_264/g.612  ORF Transcript_264/g.612 Transcript_264/m.612 type:complete len:304 (+) Transcript_264:79-990(+)|eukprot:CAMPEP_0202364830 /NCGR_PEP_ID=MMETSP1126-20121109/16085_1 /ASSEMBLY_ACC=CAM_ASM_000457 /TAXON_ID=3047 /ORGANISM="Dunaliella tertiolecta, Strain CCMP1320" /LENGTH=303 /DNA_ID=CAMNT_0048959559 /DNA_START=27 /DNA_END=938 /DNA_ORIENTATION=+